MKSRKKLQEMFNVWKLNSLPREERDTSYCRFKFARKSFRKPVQHSKNQASVEHYMNIDKLKNTKPKSYWRNIKLDKLSSKKLFIVNDKTST